MRLLEIVPVEEAANGGLAKEGRVAVEDEKVAVETLEQRKDLQNSVTGAERFRLGYIMEAGTEVLADVVLPVADDHIDTIRRHEVEHILDYGLQDAAVTEW